MNLSKVSYVQVGGVAVFLIAVALLVASFSGQVKVTVNPTDAKADGGGAQHISGLFIPDESGQKLGTASSPAVSNDGCYDVNGTTICDYGAAFTVASTSCAFRLPSATSTLRSAVAIVKNPQGTANQGEWGYSRTDKFSTTTSLGANTISGTVQTVIAASSTPTWTLNPSTILPPNGWLVFKQGSTTPTGVVGHCSAEIQTI